MPTIANVGSKGLNRRPSLVLAPSPSLCVLGSDGIVRNLCRNTVMLSVGWCASFYSDSGTVEALCIERSCCILSHALSRDTSANENSNAGHLT